MKLQSDSGSVRSDVLVSLQASSLMTQREICPDQKKWKVNKRKHSDTVHQVDLDFVARTAKTNEWCCSCARRILSGQPLLQQSGEVPEDSVRVNKLHSQRCSSHSLLKLLEDNRPSKLNLRGWHHDVAYKLAAPSLQSWGFISCRWML